MGLVGETQIEFYLKSSKCQPQHYQLPTSRRKNIKNSSMEINIQKMESQDTRKSLVRPGSVLEEKPQLKSLLSFWSWWFCFSYGQKLRSGCAWHRFVFKHEQYFLR